MLKDASTVEALLSRTRSGDDSAIDELLEQHGPYLRLLALRQLDVQLDAGLDVPQIIEQTCRLARQRMDKFHGSSAAEFIGWLKRIHVENIENIICGHFRAAPQPEQKKSPKRDPRTSSESVDRQSTRASQRCMLSVKAVHLAANIEQLPGPQQEAIRLRHLEGLPLAEIALRLGRSEQAIAGLLRRGVLSLKRVLSDQG